MNKLNTLLEELIGCFEQYKKIVDLIIKSVRKEGDRESIITSSHYAYKLNRCLLDDIQRAIRKESDDEEKHLP